ncbi:V-type ATP synthase subunit D [Patescibacteria group bacterium]|nr:V-type ATP synthase subunit D [Patescibacteria group bacterium]MBU1247000.1 V-type ATP synthase subunit D [Patescibacteria group bacterium]MBU1519483.1 V-type ATP synthase subunit D [Patescibacteria group bacterium]MBU1730520.1 V-type ATP synthase subunit D [Patescibacteria group bacterium]MBU1956708.1 V-type ATP synthase subunit D [Patescibacteria group bacterium]
MTILKVTPTRITLLNLKKELKVAQKGYKLLKDKRDGLMKKFMEIIRTTRQLREAVEEQLGNAFSFYVKATAPIHPKTIEAAFLVPDITTTLTVDVKNIMSVPIPQFHIKKEGYAFSYGILETNGDLDNAIIKFDKVFCDMVKLAELEKTAENLAKEIERTRRRVSALENTRIPNLEDTIHFITQQLEERARDAIVSTMRVKAMIIAKENLF